MKDEPETVVSPAARAADIPGIPVVRDRRLEAGTSDDLGIAGP